MCLVLAIGACSHDSSSGRPRPALDGDQFGVELRRGTTPIAGKTVTLRAGRVQLDSATTDAAGRAVLAEPAPAAIPESAAGRVRTVEIEPPNASAATRIDAAAQPGEWVSLQWAELVQCGDMTDDADRDGDGATDDAGVGTETASPPRACRTELLPDLVPGATVREPFAEESPGPDRWALDATSQPGRELLRFGTVALNLGRGPLHVVGLDPEASGAGANEQDIVQRIYTDAGGYRDRLAGRFVYHPTHKHIHVADFERYELIPAPANNNAGGVTGSSNAGGATGNNNAAGVKGSKVSFCLTDVLSAGNVGDGAGVAYVDPTVTQPAPVRIDLPPMECGAIEQGLNPGMGDYYGPGLADQWIDITGVPDGSYVLRITVDPEQLLTEADETNNSVDIPVALFRDSAPRYQP